MYKQGPFGWKEFETKKADRILMIKEEKRMMEDELKKYQEEEKKGFARKRSGGAR